MSNAKKTGTVAFLVALAERDFVVEGFAPAVEETPAGGVGRKLRTKTPRSAHAEFAPAVGRPSVVDSVESANENRIASLIPIRVGRMAASQFAFMRGSAGLMAMDLAATPNTGLAAQLCGDAHAANVGVYGGSDDQIVIDINDFDETLPEPWEWDLKRLASSLVLTGRELSASEDSCSAAVFESVGSYRKALRLLASMPALEAWRAVADEKFLFPRSWLARFNPGATPEPEYDPRRVLWRATDGVPAERLEALVREIGPVHHTKYGAVAEIRASAGANDIAETSFGLAAHTREAADAVPVAAAVCR